MTAPADRGARVVDFAFERAKRRGAGWSALEAELVEVPPLVLYDAADELRGYRAARACARWARFDAPAGVQLSIFEPGFELELEEEVFAS